MHANAWASKLTNFLCQISFVSIGSYTVGEVLKKNRVFGEIFIILEIISNMNISPITNVIFH